MSRLRHLLHRAMDDDTWRQDPRWRRYGLGLLAVVLGAWLLVFHALIQTWIERGEQLRASQRQPR